MRDPGVCSHCKIEISIYVTQCPHCGTPGLYPNVNAAELAEERAALERRYRDALETARKADLLDVAQQFENAVARSRVVMNVQLPEAMRLASNDSEVRATFYGMADSRVPRARPPAGTDWDVIRTLVDTILFREAKEHIRFAALSLSPEGLTAYGPCTLVCREKMFEHRASTFEKNSCQFFIERGGIAFRRSVDIPAGIRTNWQDRSKLALVKLVEDLGAGMSDDDFANILIKRGATTDEDEFVEIHICGPMTIRTFDADLARIDPSAEESPKSMAMALQEKLADYKRTESEP